MKICILTLDHPTNETRVYHKIALTLARIAEVAVISRMGISSLQSNPALYLTDTESKWSTLWALYRTCRRLKPDIVICIEPWTLVVGRALQKRIGARLVYDIHEYYADAFTERFSPGLAFLAQRFYLMLERRWCRHADLYIAVNKLIVKKLLTRQQQRSRSIIIPNYPAKDTWGEVCELGGSLQYLCETEFDLVYIGGLSNDHGTFKLLKAISLLKRELSWLKVLIVGRFHFPGDETRFFKELNDYNLNAIVFYQKWIAPDKIGVLLRRSKIGLWMFNPSNQRFRKAIPLKLLEYYAAGLPVIATRSVMMNELISQNKT
ncbi:MAG: glycosyltransferase, partial [Candidatus Cloacimonetes bacterium]|nr:glycosyltransferase [Candidatus Cloacimonadota bacterium]